MEAAAVFGEPHPKAGEVPVAVVVRVEGKTLTEDALVAWAGERMASYKAPRRVVFAAFSDLPLGSTGKILRRELPKLFGRK